MKKLYTLMLLSLTASLAFAQPVCNPNGNVIIYSNYDGGRLYIVVDQNIPNLKIGICTYEAVQVTIQGTYAGNVTEVRYAGYNDPLDNCNLGVSTTDITGVPEPVDTILQYPNATLSDPNGYPQIICAVACSNGNSGGCNTSDQIAHYFQTVFNGSLLYHYTGYNCWNNFTHLVSQGGNCCLNPLTSVGDVIEESSLSVGPVPASGQVSLQAVFRRPADAVIEIVNVLGGIEKSLVRNNAAVLNESISVADLAAGIYFIRIRAGEQTVMKKIAVE
ncbi:MAG: T9SS type A sorting domain-containing protein [Bacteroidota bacterium]